MCCMLTQTLLHGSGLHGSHVCRGNWTVSNTTYPWWCRMLTSQGHTVLMAVQVK